MNIKWLNEISINDLLDVGGKNASLGEMYNNLSNIGILIPNAFVCTTSTFNKYIIHNKLTNDINELLKNINTQDLGILQNISLEIRNKIKNGKFPVSISNEILDNYEKLSNLYDLENVDVAIRSSSTAEDLKDASFAGLQETYLNINGKENVLKYIKKCFASLYTERAISYRKTMNYDREVTISVCIQKMVRSDLAYSGVAFSIDTESGFKDIVLINGSWGLGEMVVGGMVKPDEFLVYKNKLKDNVYCPIIEKKLGDKNRKMVYGENNEKTKIMNVDINQQNQFCMKNEVIIQLAKWVVEIEKYYSKLYNRWCPMDIEWAYDGSIDTLFIVQARPETVQSNKQDDVFIEYKINSNKKELLLEGISIGDKIGQGKVNILKSIHDPFVKHFKKGDILVTDITDPDWEPIMKLASGIITNKGGRVCHAAIVARELGIPAIVGTISATNILNNDDLVTISCIEGTIGYIYKGILEYDKIEHSLSTLPKINTNIMFNVGNPDQAFKVSKIPNKGVGLAREEFIINNYIGIHPLALIEKNKIIDTDIKNKINSKIVGYINGRDFFIEKLSYGIAKIAAAFYPKDVIVRLSDFKSNEYYNLLGGKYFEPIESNPMIGWRGCSRYYSKEYKEAFELECIAIKKVREIMGFENVIVMLPFCRTPLECKQVLEVMSHVGLKRNDCNLKIALMCELPVNCILADEFCKLVDIFSIGSNDLTQTTLAVDRDSELISHIFDERNEAVKKLIQMAIQSCKKNNVKIGICGQGPSDYPDFAQFLVENGIDSISITPDAIFKTYNAIHQVENKL